jgi:hypothetical protein
MANGIGVQLAVFLVPAAIIVCVLVLKMKKARPAPSSEQPAAPRELAQTKPIQRVPPPVPAEANRQMPAKITAKPVSASTQNVAAVAAVTAVAASPAPLPVRIEVQGAPSTSEDRRERILATISENIRKSLPMRQAAQGSPVPYSESKPRNTEYVRVKKEIITPHDQIRFSILKDWVSINMLAIFRRASLDWETPDDLIALLPAYLSPEAEILNGQVLLIGTRGHSEKLAVPIRTLDAASGLQECFDFVTDVRTVTNTPAVLRTSETEFEIVCRGIITRALFANAIEQGEQRDMKLLVDRSSEDLQQRYAAAMRQIESAVSADAH